MENCVLATPRSFALTSPEPVHMLEEAGFQVLRLERPADGIITATMMAEATKDVQAIIIGIEPLNRVVLEQASKLRLISKYGVGMDNIDIEAARSRGITLGWTPGANSNAVAELTLGLMFSLARRIPQADQALHAGQFERMRGLELHGRVLGVIGLGRIGVRLAKAASCLGMRVLAYDPFLTESPLAEVDMVDQVQLYQQADVISLHLPLTEQTRHMIDAQALKAMKPGVLLINTARGGIVDERALYDALQAGILGGAAIDCFSQEPASNSPLLKLKRVIGTPHIASHTQEASEAMGRMAAENVIAGLKGKPLPYPFEGSRIENTTSFEGVQRMSVSEEIIVQHEVGLHARPAAQFVKLAATFGADIQLENLTKGTNPVNAKSIISVLSVNVVQDDKIRITAKGEKEQEAITALMDLIACNFEVHT